MHKKLSRRGFTFIEIMVVLIIVGVLASMAIPDFIASTERARAQDAQNNLLSIYAAQLNYYNNNNQAGFFTGTCDDSANCTLASTLGINIMLIGWTYSCTGNVSTFSCTATRSAISGFTLTVTGPTTAIDLVSTGSGRNPSCTGPVGYCPF